MIGKDLLNYRVLEKIGAGGYSQLSAVACGASLAGLPELSSEVASRNSADERE